MKKPRKTTRLSHKDVQIEYLTGGAARIQSLLDAGRVGKLTVRKAAAELERQGYAHTAGDLLALVPTAGRGRKPAEVGSSRTYKAQQVRDGEVFLRLPLSVLGVKKGEGVRVSFTASAIAAVRA